jgi:hypothetical protein
VRLSKRSTLALTTLAATAGLGLSLLQPVASATPRDPSTSTTTAAARQAAEDALSAVQAEAQQVAQARRNGAGTAASASASDLSLKLTRLALVKADLSPADRRVANGYLARPTGGGDNVGGYIVRYKKGLTVKNDCTGRKPGATSGFCVNWVSRSDNAPSNADRNGKRDHDGIPDYIEKVRSTMQHVWSTEVGSYGYKAPLRDNRGPNRKLDIYIANLGAGRLYGYCTGEQLVSNWTASGYCVLDNNYTERIFDAHTPTQNLQVTAAHEFFHAVQYAYDAAEDTWMMEGTAAWIEDEVYDKVNDNLQYLRASPLSDPGNPLDESFNATYGSWIWWRHLSETYGRGIVRAMWNRADDSRNPDGDNYSLLAVAAELNARGTTLPKELATFAAGNRAPKSSYSEGARYPTAPAARTNTLSSGTPSESQQSVTIDHLASATDAVTRGSGLADTAELRVDVDGPQRGTSPVAVLTSYDASGAPMDTQTLTLNRNGVGNGTIGFGYQVKRVDVTLVNASNRFTCWQDNIFSCQGNPKDDNKTFTWRASVL